MDENNRRFDEQSIQFKVDFWFNLCLYKVLYISRNIYNKLYSYSIDETSAECTSYAMVDFEIMYFYKKEMLFSQNIASVVEVPHGIK